MIALLLLLGCTPIVIVERDTLDLEEVTVTPAAPWSVDFEVTASPAAMDLFYSGEVVAFLADASGEGAVTATMAAFEETAEGELDLEWSRSLELYVEPWEWCLPGDACTVTGSLEVSGGEAVSFTPSLTGTVLVQTTRRSLPDDVEVEVSLVD